MKSEFLRVASVAEWLDVSSKRVYAMIQEGKLQAIRLGPRQTRVPRKSVEELIESLSRLHSQDMGLESDDEGN